MTYLVEPQMIVRDAELSACMSYRYALSRLWDDEREMLIFVGLNPSTADAQHDDATLRRCIGFARAWGYGGLWMLNLFAYRATDPASMMCVADPVGRENDPWIEEVMRREGNRAVVVAAWGWRGNWRGRDAVVTEMMREHGASLMCLGYTVNGAPRHPLYVPASQKLMPFLARQGR